MTLENMMLKHLTKIIIIITINMQNLYAEYKMYIYIYNLLSKYIQYIIIIKLLKIKIQVCQINSYIYFLSLCQIVPYFNS